MEIPGRLFSHSRLIPPVRISFLHLLFSSFFFMPPPLVYSSPILNALVSHDLGRKSCPTCSTPCWNCNDQGPPTGSGPFSRGTRDSTLRGVLPTEQVLEPGVVVSALPEANDATGPLLTSTPHK